jgi:hypothetical protein
VSEVYEALPTFCLRIIRAETRIMKQWDSKRVFSVPWHYVDCNRDLEGYNYFLLECHVRDDPWKEFVNIRACSSQNVLSTSVVLCCTTRIFLFTGATWIR